MKLVRLEIFGKTSDSLSLVTTAVRNTSCSHGWLRLVIHCFFGAMTVTSFILIVIMAMKSSSPKHDTRCTVNGCRVVCHNTPYLEDYEDNILLAVADAEEVCKGIRLVLNEPHFVNSTMPAKWLQKLRSTVVALEIVKGNLQQISPKAFMTHLGEQLRTLSFEGITIVRWGGRTLLGLIHLETLRIDTSTIGDISPFALRTVDATLQNLFITGCGDWTPSTLTGSSNLVQLSVLEFSNNNFPILRNNSFTKLQSCKVLYLDYCNISVIEQGTFDYLASIEVIYLDNNHLTMVTPGLFDTLFSLTNPLPRISIHENNWHCNCSNHDLRELNRRGMVVVETVCSAPEEFNGTSFLDFEYFCQNQYDSGVLRYNETIIPSPQESTSIDNSIINFKGTCQNSEKSMDYTRFYHPTRRLKCSSQAILKLNSNMDHEKAKAIITPRYAVADSDHVMLEISSSGSSRYGLVWYQSLCPQEIYCLNVLPKLLRIYEIDLKTKYTFCPMQLSTGNVQTQSCVNYIVEEFDRKSLAIKIIGYLITSIFFLASGAICLYAIILKFPALLKGSKRILFVKHKNVHALILPPKVPLKSVLSGQSLPCIKENKIFLVSDPLAQKNYLSDDFMSVLSRRSSKSISPSYVSALEPTDDQLADWRLRHHFLRDTAHVNSFDNSAGIEDEPDSSISDTVYESCQ